MSDEKQVSPVSLIERMARAIYETQDNPVPWDSETLDDWRRNYEREKARAALAVVHDHDRGAVDLLREARAFLDTRHGSDGKLRRPANLIERIDAAVTGEQ